MSSIDQPNISESTHQQTSNQVIITIQKSNNQMNNQLLFISLQKHSQANENTPNIQENEKIIEENQTENNHNKDDESEEETKDQNEEKQDGDGQTEKLSKNKYKKQMKAKMWNELKEKKKEMKKEEKLKKQIEKQYQLIENGQTQTEEQPKREKQQHSDPYKSNQQLKDLHAQKARQGQPIILDMQFLHLLEQKEFKSLVKQLCYMQSANKKSENPVRFIITSVNEQLKQALKNQNADKWGIEILEQHYLDLFPKEKLVYLTGDTNQDLEELNKDEAYIIGGLVDHNRLKNVTFNAANEQGLKVRRFPIQNYLKLEASSILTCNHVFDIMVRKANGESWKDSLINSIPIRKVVAHIENGVEIPTEHHLKKLEQMKKQQEEALLKKQNIEINIQQLRQEQEQLQRQQQQQQRQQQQFQQ